MKMPFGKHKGKELDKIPKAYQRWLRQQDWVGGWLAQGLAEALGEVVMDKPREPWRPSEGEPWEGGNK